MSHEIKCGHPWCKAKGSISPGSTIPLAWKTITITSGMGHAEGTLHLCLDCFTRFRDHMATEFHTDHPQSIYLDVCPGCLRVHIAELKGLMAQAIGFIPPDLDWKFKKALTPTP